MATSKEYLQYILEQLGGIDEISHRAMMGEYVIYCKGKVVGGLYDNRFLIKPVKSARELLPDAPLEEPYPGAKEMLLVTEPEDSQLMEKLLNSVADELPAPKKRTKK
ncbi:TfoX/Sxy family protein [Lachnoclostridium sp. MSJ-17]|uniref:TfoX/Sxy family protein n=1 Tax=Lachnoclostridium sp. MSJ-17 TaxID=2841516 RepID=UPI001C128E2C|nr:TfoX/Sxy family protein [Lachnoclostridium sp. MSJ-17]MBU5462032.1 TfoX/Sxy family protein [Lachnoclostridium sp. MSJ-17]